MQPLVFFIINIQHEVLLIGNVPLRVVYCIGAGGGRANQPEFGLRQRVERLLKERVLEVVARRVPVAFSVIRISTFIERVAKHFPTHLHAAAYENPWYFAEFDIDKSVSARRERTLNE